MTTITTSILISSTPEKVWQVLTDFQRHPNWNPFIRSISGEQKVGSRLRVHVKPPGGSGMTFTPTVLVFEPYREFRWKGKLGIRGLFDGEHYFRLESTAEGSTHFVHGENFTGILVPILKKALISTEKGFHLMNQALKAECESAVGTK